MPATERKFFVIGCGSIGKRHIRNLLSLGARDVFAFDTQAQRRQAVQSEFAIPVVDALEDGWARLPNAAFVCTPTSTHLRIAMDAALRECHLFIEKPLSHNCDGVQPLVELVSTRHLISLVGCNMRFHPGLRVIRELLQKNTIGKIVSARAEAGQYLPDWHPQEDYRQSYSSRSELGGGIILDAVHEIDYLYSFFGGVETVLAMHGKLSELEIDTEDTAAILLRFSNGIIGEVHLDYIQRSYCKRCKIIGDLGTIEWDFAMGEVRVYTAVDKTWRTYRQPSEWQINDMYVDETRHFLNCLEGKENAVCDVAVGAAVLAIAMAAKQLGKREHHRASDD